VKIVLDTNVFISGAFFSGPPSAILHACIRGDFQPVLSMDILQEYERVAQLFLKGSDDADVARLIAVLLSVSLLVEARELEAPLCRDPADDTFLACALSGAAEAIVTGDKDLLSLAGSFAIPILRPKDFRIRYGLR
jgi:putative PIN family toxin of toxin-antitoxin system